MGSSNSKLTDCTECIREFKLKYGFNEKIYTKYCIVYEYQIWIWFIIMTFTGIFGQILFRIYHDFSIAEQWWWYLILYTWFPLLGIIPAISLCINFFWIGNIERHYKNISDDINSYDDDNPKTLIELITKFFKILYKYFILLIIYICRPTYVPFYTFDLEKEEALKKIIDIILYVIIGIVIIILFAKNKDEIFNKGLDKLVSIINRNIKQ